MTRRLIWLALVVPAVAGAQVNGVEALYGATNIRAAVGNGTITAAYSENGEMTVLRWPNPTFHEHLQYETAGGDNGWALQFMGAAENDGAFEGVVIGNESGVSWLRDPPWKAEVRYGGDDVDVVVRSWTWGARKVTCHSFAQADLPVLRQRCVLEGADLHTLVGYINPSLMAAHTAFDPTDQSVLDDQRDSLVEWKSDVSAFVCAAEAGDVVMAVGVDPKPEVVQAGRDDGGPPADAYLELKGSKAASGSVNMGWRVAAKQVEHLVVFGNTEAEALAALAEARDASFDEALSEKEGADRAWLGIANLPELDAELRGFAWRTLLSLRTGTDPETGAMVASVSSQPPYNLDWPRDGAFFNALLDRVGYGDRVSAHNAFYVARQRVTDGVDAFDAAEAPAGSWAMNYYADGVVGGPVDFEIDQTGLALWNLAEFSAKAPGAWVAITRAAELLTSCKDNATGLHCKASEGDNPAKTQTLRGAISTWMGLAAAVRAAKREGKSGWEPWDQRRAELETVISDRWIGQTRVKTEQWRALAWAIWPGRFPMTEQARADAVKKLLARLNDAIILAQPDGSSYDAQLTLALAWLLPAPSDERDQLEKVLKVLALEIPTPHTRHLGEVYVPDDDGGWRSHTAMPHLLEASLVTLSILMFYDHPEYEPAVEPVEPSVAAPEEETAPSVGSSGCSYGGEGGREANGLWLLCLVGVFWALRRKARARVGGCTTGD